MNRQQRRQIERETKQQILEYNNNLKWFQNWTPSQLEFHRNMVHEIEQKSFKDMEQIMDSCYIAAMIQELDISLEQAIDICGLADIHMNETREFIGKEGERYFMKANNDELRSGIKVEIKTLIKENRKINNLEIIRVLKETYDLANKDFQILCKEARQELEKEALKEIEEDIDKEVNVEVFKDGEKVDLEKVEAPTIEFKEVKDLNPNKPKLEIIDTIKKIKGKDERVYIKDSEGVKIGDKHYKDITDVKYAIKVLESNTSATEDEINKKIEELKKQLEIEQDYKRKELEKYAEIEIVFQM
ncbi:hypothetical protein [Clostridium beijerinckii]|uniref:hypothetical protein n=1 Tax=Clostridium beijerinckii TaxID=1520 RepID=UPI001F32AEDD|nr:hypothetical protein [Clostridium beijerinckii]